MVLYLITRRDGTKSIPEDVAIRFTLKKSTEEVGTSLLCDAAASRIKMNAVEQTRGVRGQSLSAQAVVGGLGDSTPRAIALLAERQPSSTQTSADPGSSASITEDTNVIRRTFARPLDEGYAKNYISRHRQLLDANTKMEAMNPLRLGLSWERLNRKNLSWDLS
ncbi:hypothetical protein C8J57DRAFT_1247862 [Mycena rebaudengoi]|nr:hypothetical protein C8J57DRAFT_1247862 [Mycena rebaudengoi]